MAEIFWDDDFRWIEAQPLPDEVLAKLTHEQVIAREEELSEHILIAFVNRWVEYKNLGIVRASRTLKEANLRNTGGEISLIPPPEEGFYFSEAA